ncbi:serine hydrolase domain-containing protein [Streptomyces sp. NPDC085929]|uniref:serine hydrolase domain-containing protein n=1 Tax=Streptomyces sp. NPDC085929 TaxID=3365739 RepID=UPI0037D70F84
MTALCMLILADRGELDLSAPVAAYGPEFAPTGKESVLVRHVLSHTAGLPDLAGLTVVEELYDWESVTAGLAAQAPEWEPGTAADYHALTFGFLVGEIVRRISGLRVGEHHGTLWPYRPRVPGHEPPSPRTPPPRLRDIRQVALQLPRIPATAAADTEAFSLVWRRPISPNHRSREGSGARRCLSAERRRRRISARR